MTTKKETIKITKNGGLVADERLISYLGTVMMGKGICVDSPWCG
jgi:hypothetical protein